MELQLGEKRISPHILRFSSLQHNLNILWKIVKVSSQSSPRLKATVALEGQVGKGRGKATPTS